MRPFVTDVSAEIVELGEYLRHGTDPDVQLDLECAPCPGRLFIDTRDLLRLLAIVIENAVEAMRKIPNAKRKNRINVRVYYGRKGGILAWCLGGWAFQKTICISIRDNCPGIPGHVLGSRRPSGLARAKELVESAGGKMQVVSQMGAGTKVVIAFPTVKSRAEGSATESAEREGQRLSSRFSAG